MEEKIEQPKYVAINPSKYDTNSFTIKDDKELEFCLKDHSLDEEDIVYQVSKTFYVRKKTEYYLEEVK